MILRPGEAIEFMMLATLRVLRIRGRLTGESAEMCFPFRRPGAGAEEIPIEEPGKISARESRVILEAGGESDQRLPPSVAVPPVPTMKTVEVDQHRPGRIFTAIPVCEQDVGSLQVAVEEPGVIQTCKQLNKGLR